MCVVVGNFVRALVHNIVWVVDKGPYPFGCFLAHTQVVVEVLGELPAVS